MEGSGSNSGSGAVPLTIGSGSGRPKNIRIRIRNSAKGRRELALKGVLPSLVGGKGGEGSMHLAVIKAWKVVPSLAALAGAAWLRLLAFQLLVYM
jgi:hypothetical protein